MKQNRPNRLSAKLKKHGSSLAVFLLFIAGIVVLSRTLHKTSLQDIYIQIQTLPSGKILLAMLFTLLNYAALTGYDWSALLYVGKKLSFPVIAFTSFTGFSLGNTLGVSWLSGGAVRYRFYSRVGLSFTEITLIIAFCSVGFILGETLVGTTALAIHPAIFADYFSIPQAFIRWGAVFVIVTTGLLLCFGSLRRSEIRLGKKKFRLPSLGILCAQILFSLLDIGLAGATLFILLPDGTISYSAFIAVYAIALVLAVVSSVPAGLGVFEAVMATALHPYIPLEVLTAALVVYRIIYYFLPFLGGIFLLAGSEIYLHVQKRRRDIRPDLQGSLHLISKVVYSAVPPALAGLTFISGSILLLGSSVALSPHTLHLLGKFFPVELIELSHILGGVVGIILIILSFSLWQRVRVALWISSVLFLVGALLSFMQTLDYDRTVVLLLTLVLLLSCRKPFYRHARLFSDLLDVKWLLLTLAALAGFLWLLFFSYQATGYQNELWWQFALDKQAPRGMRTAVVAVSTFLITFILAALRPPRRLPAMPDGEELERAQAIIQQQDDADGNFALTADKRLLFSENNNSFIMFSIRNRSWVALGDPIGSDRREQVNLIWEFKAMAAREQGNAVFYQVKKEHIDWYIDAGFYLYKLGEEARVQLGEFGLSGKRRSKLRQAMNKADRAGLSFTIVSPPHDDHLLDALADISDQWLTLKSVREKSFSLGRFNREYLNRFPLALVHEKDRLTAFANVFGTETKAEATIDLMRHLPDAEKNTMDFLFISLMLHLKEKGFVEFSLGMAPLSGFMDHEHARLWDRFGMMLYKKGKRFYNFEGLWHFKNKFLPQWTPRYLATTGKGVSPFLTLMDIAALISGGIKGVFKK